MHLSPTLSSLFWLACLANVLLPLIRSFPKKKSNLKNSKLQLKSFVYGLPILLIAYLAAFLLKLDVANTLLFALGGFLVSWLLACLNLSTGVTGIALLIIGYLIADLNVDSATSQMPLLAYLFGVLIVQWITPYAKIENFLLPATFCAGSYWIALSSPEGWGVTYQTLLILSLSILLITRSLQALPFIPENRMAQASFVTIVTGLLAWFGIQTLLVQPGLLHWAWLLAGGSLLSFLFSDSDAETPSLPRNAIYLIITGIVALIASRLFGTVGWVVLAPMLISQRKPGKVAGLVSLFFIARVILQSFIYQFNPNVTGINITHPYASAALYAGFALMLILPNLLNLTFNPQKTDEQPLTPLPLVTLATITLVSAGLANYFLHAEATGSLLTALVIGGLGVSLLGNFSSAANRFYPLLMSILMSLGCLLGNALIASGNSADKTEKLWVLGGALVFVIVLTLISQGKPLRREPVEVS